MRTGKLYWTEHSVRDEVANRHKKNRRQRLLVSSDGTPALRPQAQHTVIDLGAFIHACWCMLMILDVDFHDSEIRAWPAFRIVPNATRHSQPQPPLNDGQQQERILGHLHGLSEAEQVGERLGSVPGDAAL